MQHLWLVRRWSVLVLSSLSTCFLGLVCCVAIVGMLCGFCWDMYIVLQRDFSDVFYCLLGILFVVHQHVVLYSFLCLHSSLAFFNILKNQSSYPITAKLEDLYAFTYRLSDHSSQSQGWDFFDLQSEYLRLGVPNQNWVLSNINKDYHVIGWFEIKLKF